MTKRQRLAVMLPILAVLAWLVFFSEAPKDGVVAEAVARRADRANSSNAPVLPAENALSHPVRGGLSSRTERLQPEESSTHIDIFAASGVTGAPVQQSATPHPAVDRPFVFIGRLQEQSVWSAFLEREGRTYVLRPGDRAEGFRLDAVGEKELSLTDLSTRARVVVPLGSDAK